MQRKTLPSNLSNLCLLFLKWRAVLFTAQLRAQTGIELTHTLDLVLAHQALCNLVLRNPRLGLVHVGEPNSHATLLRHNLGNHGIHLCERRNHLPDAVLKLSLVKVISILALDHRILHHAHGDAHELELAWVHLEGVNSVVNLWALHDVCGKNPSACCLIFERSSENLGKSIQAACNASIVKRRKQKIPEPRYAGAAHPARVPMLRVTTSGFGLRSSREKIAIDVTPDHFIPVSIVVPILAPCSASLSSIASAIPARENSVLVCCA